MMLGLILLLAASQASGTQTAELFVGCPAGATLETASDPRAGPLSGPARLVVRCLTQRTLPSSPQCAAGFRLAVAPVADVCKPVTVGDGTSNTVNLAVGSVRSIGGNADGTSNTLPVGERAQPVASGRPGGAPTTAPTPACPGGAQLAIDGGGFADTCVTRSFAPPGEPVPVTRR